MTASPSATRPRAGKGASGEPDDGGRGDPRSRGLPTRACTGAAPGPGEALVKVQAVGICASDLKCFHGAPMYWGDEPIPSNVDLFATPGHEFVGEIVAVDDLGRQRWSVDTGDRVVAEQIVPCWECRFCRRGQYWMCAPHNIFGFRRVVNGAMAEYMSLPRRSHRVQGVPRRSGCARSLRRTAVVCAARRRAGPHRVWRRRGRRRLRPDRFGHDRRCSGESPGQGDCVGPRACEARLGRRMRR